MGGGTAEFSLITDPDALTEETELPLSFVGFGPSEEVGSSWCYNHECELYTIMCVSCKCGTSTPSLSPPQRARRQQCRSHGDE